MNIDTPYPSSASSPNGRQKRVISKFVIHRIWGRHDALGSQPLSGRRDRPVRSTAGRGRERHRHRYEVNNTLVPKSRPRNDDFGGRRISLVEMVELADHPWFVACQFHPEFIPPRGISAISSFISAAVEVKADGAEDVASATSFYWHDQPFVLVGGVNVLESNSLSTLRVLTKKYAELNIPLVFRASYDRQTVLRSLVSRSWTGRTCDLTVKKHGAGHHCDVHTPEEAAPASVVDIIQLPAFLARQTDLVRAMAETRPPSISKASVLSLADEQHRS